MSHVAGLPPTAGIRPALPRQVPSPGRTDRSVDPRTPIYRQVERSLEQEQADHSVGGQRPLPPTGVEPVSTQSVLHLRHTAAPVARIAEAYGLAPAAVRRMLAAAGRDPAAGGTALPDRGTVPVRD